MVKKRLAIFLALIMLLVSISAPSISVHAEEDDEQFEYYSITGVDVPENLGCIREYNISPVVEKILFDDDYNEIFRESLEGDSNLRFRFEYDEDEIIIKNRENELLQPDEIVSNNSENNYYVVRLKPLASSFNVIAELFNDEEGSWEQICDSEVNLEAIELENSFEGLRGDSDTWVYDYEECSVTVHSPIIDDLEKGLDVEWKLYSYKINDTTGESREELDYTLDTRDNNRTVVLDGDALTKEIDFEHYNIRVGASIIYAGKVIDFCEFGLVSRKAREDYNFQYDYVKTLVNYSFIIDKTFSGYVDNSSYLDGYNFECFVTNVEITNGSDNTCYVEEREEGFRVYTKAEGEYIAVVNFINYTGEELSYEIPISVRGDIIYMSSEFPNNTDQMSPNSEIEIGTHISHEWLYSDGNEGRASIDSYYIEIAEEEGNPCYDTSLINASIEEDGKTIKVTSLDKNGITNIQIHITAIAHEGQENEFVIEDYENVWVNVTDYYNYFDSESIWVERNLKVNDTCTISPKLMERIVVDGEIITQEAEGTIRYRIGSDDFEGDIQFFDVNGEVVDNWSAANCGSYEYTIKRLCPYNGRIRVIAERLEDDCWVEIRSQDIYLDEIWYNLEFDGLLEDGLVYIFKDEIRDISVISDIFQDYNDVQVKWEVYGLNRENQAEDSRYDLYEYWKTGTETDYALEGQYVSSFVSWEDTILRIRAAVCIGGYELGSKEFSLDYIEKENYYFIEDQDVTMVPRGEKVIDREIRGFVRDQYHPFGEDIYVYVTDVDVRNCDGGKIPKVCSVIKEGGDFKIIANNYGSAEVTVSYFDYNGQEQSYNFIVNVATDVLYLDIAYSNNNELMLLNSTNIISTTLRHEWYYSEDAKGSEMIDDYVINISQDEDGNPSYNPDLIDVVVLEDGKTLQVDTKDCLGDSDIHINTEFLLDYDNEMISLSVGANAHITCTDSIYYLEDLEYDADAKVGDTIYVYPVVKQRRIDNGEVITEDVDENVYYTFDYEEETLKVNVLDNGFEITRKIDGKIRMNIRSMLYAGNRVYIIGNTVIDFNEVDHEWVIYYDWSDDSSKCYARAYCQHDLESKYETVYSTKALKEPASCTTDEIITCLATFENDLFKTQSKEIKGKKAFGHTLTCTTKEATLYENGKKETKCTVCEKVTDTKTIYAAKEIKLSTTKYAYDGNVKTPSVIVKDSKGNEIASSNYTVTYSTGRKNVGKYTVKITFKNDYSGSRELSFTIVPKTTTIGTPAIASDGITVKWTKNTSCAGYYIYRSVNGASYTKVKTIESNATVSWKDTTAKTNGNKYQYKIIAYKTVSGTTYTSTASAIKTTYFLTRPTVTLANQASAIKVSWGKNAKATGYYVYKSTDGGKTYKKVKTVTSNATVSYTDTAAKTNGTKYMYKVEAYKTVSSTTYKSAVSAVKTYYFVSKPAISSLTNSAAGKILIKWARNAKATGYQIQYSTSSSFISPKSVTATGTASTLSKTIGSLTKGKTYYVRIRSYKTVGTTKYYSAWSATKSVKIVK